RERARCGSSYSEDAPPFPRGHVRHPSSAALPGSIRATEPPDLRGLRRPCSFHAAQTGHSLPVFEAKAETADSWPQLPFERETPSPCRLIPAFLARPRI